MNREVERVSAKELREKLEDILGVYFYELYAYFWEITLSDYDYVVLLARRCLVLYNIFQELFEQDAELEGGTMNRRRPHLMSDKAIGQLFAIRDKAVRILVVDDVAIHGNHLWSVYRKIEEALPKAEITPKVYMLSECQKSSAVPETFWKRLQWCDQSHSGQWMELSNRIVSTIYCSNKPYISYLSAYHLDKIALENPNSYSNTTVVSSANSARHHLGCRAEVVFCNEERAPFLLAVSHLDCMRVYKSRYDSQAVVIPYSFTRALRTSTIQEFFRRLAGLLPANMPHTKAQLSTPADSDAKVWKLYQQRLFKALTSHIFGLYFFHNRCHPGGMLSFDLEMSFDAETARELREITYKDIEPLLQHGADELGNYFCNSFKENSHFAECFASIREEGLSSDTYMDYIYRHREYEEQRIAKNECYSGKLPGLSVDYILGQENTPDNKRFAAARILNLNDSGCATSCFAYNEDESAVASFLSNGEQSFCVYLGRYPFIIRKMIFLEERGRDVSAYLKALEAWVQPRIQYADKMMRELYEFYNGNKGRLSAVNVTSILEEPDYWSDDDERKLSAFHRKYFAIE